MALIAESEVEVVSPTRGRALLPIHLLRPTMSLDLSPVAGREVTVRWTLLDRSEPGEVVELTGLRLRPAAAEAPDILVVCADTLRADVSTDTVTGSPMPRLQARLADARVFERAYSTATWTLPSLASVLSGMSPRFHRTGQRIDKVGPETFDEYQIPTGHFAFEVAEDRYILRGFPAGLPTVTERLAASGYTTVVVPGNPLYGLSGLSAAGSDVIVDLGLPKGDQVNGTASRLLDQLEGSEPLLLWVHYMEPHEWVHRRRPVDADGESGADLLSPAAAYRQSVAELDEFLDDLLADWFDRRRSRPQAVLFFSDHGELLAGLGENGAVGHGHSMDDALLRVPLAVWATESLGVTRGRVSTPVSLLDVAPTLLDLAGLGAGGMEGHSLLAESAVPRTLFADYQLYLAEQSSVRRGHHQLVIDFDAGRSTLLGPRVDDSSAVQAQLLEAFQNYREAADRESASLRPGAAIDQEEAARSLRALGYVR